MVVLLASVAILSFYIDRQCTLPTSKAGNGTNGEKKKSGQEDPEGWED